MPERPSTSAQDPLLKLVQELADENLQLRLKVDELEAQLVRRSYAALERGPMTTFSA